MKESYRNIDRKKAFTGVFLVCLAVILMLVERDSTPISLKVIRVVLLSAGLGLYVWGRFFSRGGD